MTSFEQLIEAIDNGTVEATTAEGGTGGGTPQTWGSQLSQYTANSVTCTEVTGKSGFSKLDSGKSDANWEGVPAFASMYNQFDQPSLYPPVTLFCKKDLDHAYSSGAVALVTSIAWVLLAVQAICRNIRR